MLITAEETENPPSTADDTADPTSVETGSIVSPDDLTAILETLQQQYVSEKEVRVNIQRKHIWSDFKQARKKFNLEHVPSHKIKIVFLGEPAVDDGSPRREFFSGKLIRANGLVGHRRKLIHFLKAECGGYSSDL